MQGVAIADPHDLLVGTATMRHYKPHTLDEVKRNRTALDALVKAAVELHAP
ncbi:MAG: hypothetical protein GX542_06630 [Rhodococcus sp.]|nr:hypothetical protein [Rhodococcus sp. (in: high G+C Gram-positive bacteria)]